MDSILAKIERLSSVINGTQHYIRQIVESIIVVSFESTTLADVEKAISSFHQPTQTSFFSLGINVTIEDRTSVFKMTKDLLESQGIQDPFQMPPGISGDGFNVEVDLYAIRESIGFSYIDCVADALANHLSRSLGTRAMVRVEDFNIPLFIYEKGKIIYQSLEAHESFYRNRRWKPT